MRKIVVVAVVVIIISGMFPVSNRKEEREPFNQLVISTPNGISAVYQNGEDVTDWYLESNDKAMSAVKNMFSISKNIEFVDICHLENQAITLAAIIDGENYSFLCNFDGEILQYSQPKTLINPKEEAEKFIASVEAMD